MSSDEEASQDEKLMLDKAACCSVRSKNTSPRHFQTHNRRSRVRSFQCKNLHDLHVRCNSKDHWSMPQTPSPYFMGSKKRQNGDKNEQIANSKRTCPSGRLFHNEWTDSSRKKNVIMENSDHSHSDKEENFDYSDECVGRKSNFGSFRALAVNDHDSSPSEMTDQRSENSIPTSTDGPNSSICSSGCTDSSASNLNRLPQQSIFSDILSQPSTSKFGQPCNESENNNTECSSSTKATKYVESDDDSRSSVNSTSLKGGCQSDGIRPMRKVVGRGCRKILESDDSSDNDWVCHYRKPSRCVSTDSDDSSDFPVKPRRKQFTKFSLSRLSSSDSNDDFVSHPPSHLPHHSRNSGAVKKPCNTSHARTPVNTFENDFLGEHSYASLDMSSNKAINSATPSPRSHSNHGAPASPLIGRHRYSRQKGSSRRSVSPHPRMLSNRRRPRISNSSSNHFKSQDGRHHSHLASEFPDLFDDAEEDSSEVEFFTAYSDTETSESINGVDLSHFPANRIPHRNNTIVLSSDEDEISIIFSSDSPHTSVRDRSGHSRGSAQRRRIRSAGCNSLPNTQTVPSASPDPVEQVRQVEEDERYARRLQAEFDAEAARVSSFLNVGSTDTASLDIPPALVTVPLPTPSDLSHPSGPRRETPWYPDVDPSTPTAPPVTTLTNTGFYTTMTTTHAHPSRRIRGGRIGFLTNVTDTSGRRRRAPRTFQLPHGDPWMWQFARVLGLGPAYSPHNNEENDYEALMNLVETVGEVLPRGLHKTEINRLPTRKFYSPGSGASSSQACDEIVHKRTELNKECQVCLCDYENGDLLRILPCFHEFHTPCIDPWLKINHTCPVCRVEVTFDD